MARVGRGVSEAQAARAAAKTAKQLIGRKVRRLYFIQVRLMMDDDIIVGRKLSSNVTKSDGRVPENAKSEYLHTPSCCVRF